MVDNMDPALMPARLELIEQAALVGAHASLLPGFPGKKASKAW
jgi:hypothetical protein